MVKVVDHERRRVELAEAVLGVIERQGINEVSVRTVAAEAGWSRGVIAHYFASRDDLLLFAYRLALQRESDLLPTAEDEPDPLERLVRALCRLLPVDAQSSVDFKVWLGFMGRVADNPALGAAVLHEHEQWHSRIHSLVEQCVTAKALIPTMTISEATESLIIFVNGLGVTVALNPTRYPAETLANWIRRQLTLWVGAGAEVVMPLGGGES